MWFVGQREYKNRCKFIALKENKSQENIKTIPTFGDGLESRLEAPDVESLVAIITEHQSTIVSLLSTDGARLALNALPGSFPDPFCQLR